MFLFFMYFIFYYFLFQIIYFLLAYFTSYARYRAVVCLITLKSQTNNFSFFIYGSIHHEYGKLTQ